MKKATVRSGPLKEGQEWQRLERRWAVTPVCVRRYASKTGVRRRWLCVYDPSGHLRRAYAELILSQIRHEDSSGRTVRPPRSARHAQDPGDAAEPRGMPWPCNLRAEARVEAFKATTMEKRHWFWSRCSQALKVCIQPLWTTQRGCLAGKDMSAREQPSNIMAWAPLGHPKHLIYTIMDYVYSLKDPWRLGSAAARINATWCPGTLDARFSIPMVKAFKPAARLVLLLPS
ncbi:hypothetical protein CDD81_3698 [Ophiocordyceps australis]|uniref:Uncharacterized protein n=1 Tax=Ophiocordyceps australis TaxID=1399860 RepID=A0A2C5XVM2_9HYPO|nr:hypothetical protein CDD81_3698 [Ophiocordyceps australis]